jgi:hypothetical protein
LAKPFIPSQAQVCWRSFEMDTNIFLTVVFSILGSLTWGVLALIVLVVIGIIIIALIKLFLVLIPAIIVAVIVYFLTFDLFWTGVAFLVIAALAIIAKL